MSPGPGQGLQDMDSAPLVEGLAGGTQLNVLAVDRPWGPRTAAFADPASNVWEIAGPAS